MSSTQLQTPEVGLDKIHVVEGFNPRKQFDQDALERLAKTIKANGVIQPVRVKQREDGEFDLVAGERRYRAAKIAGRTKIPITLSTGNAHAEALIENLHRKDLDPIETALGLRAVAQEHGLDTNAKIAAHQKVSENWVGAHLRLLDLPEAVQIHIAAGDVPVAAEPKLRKIAEVSPDIAELICKVAKEQEVSASYFVERFGDLLRTAGRVEVKGKPTMVSTRQCRLSDVISKRTKKFGKLVERINAVSSWENSDPDVGFAEAEIDAARAAGCLVEYGEGGQFSHQAFITDLPLARDLVERAVDRREKEVADRIEAQAAEKARRREEQAEHRQQQKEAGEESAQAKAKQRKGIARRWNDSLKRALLKKRTAARRKQYALPRVKALLVQLISDNPDLAAAGMRLVSDQLQDKEEKPLKKGGVKTTVIYAGKEDSTDWLLRRVMAAKDVAEAVEIGAEALLAGLLADTEEFPNKDHARWYSRVDDELEKLLKAEIKEVRPRKERKPR